MKFKKRKKHSKVILLKGKILIPLIKKNSKNTSCFKLNLDLVGHIILQILALFIKLMLCITEFFVTGLLIFSTSFISLDFEYFGMLTNSVFILPLYPSILVNAHACRKKDFQVSLWIRWWNFIAQIEVFLFSFLNALFTLFIYLFIYFWLCWVFVSVRGLSLVAASGGHSSSRCAGLSQSRPLLLRSTGSRRAGSVTVAHGPSCSAACGIFPDQGSNPCPLHWQADSQPLCHQGSPEVFQI